LLTVSPAFGGYVAKTLSKLQFSPMMMMTCLIGVVVFPSRTLGPYGPAPDAGYAMADWAPTRARIVAVTAAPWRRCFPNACLRMNFLRAKVNRR